MIANTILNQWWSCFVSQRRHILFTSESFTEGHPDKIADQISDSILDACLEQDPHSRVACDTLVSTGLVIISGEITTKAYVDLQSLVRGVIASIGYDNALYGFDANTCAVISTINKQSSDIYQGVDMGGAGDQGMVYGYATNETPELMPPAICLAHKLTRQLSLVRKNGKLPYLRPDGKSQVTIEYDWNGKPSRIDSVALSVQHAESIGREQIVTDILKYVIQAVLPAAWLDENTKYYINPTGRFVIGGPMGDTGLTGRKIVADTYGGKGGHVGGVFSGRDPTKVERSAAYLARYIAKNLVAAGLASHCEIQLVYTIGEAEPVYVGVDTFGTGTLSDSAASSLVRAVFQLTPRAIINGLNLRRPIYRDTSVYGHFGRSEPTFTWEMTDKAGVLHAAAGKYLSRESASTNASELLLTLISADGESGVMDHLWIEGELESIARTNQAWIEEITGEAGGSGVAIITGTVAGFEHAGIIVGILAAVAAPLSAAIGAWIQSKNGRKVRFKVGPEGVDIEANSPDDIAKLLELAKQLQKDTLARVLIER
jgi:S-adenosylmethionine synthetase